MDNYVLVFYNTQRDCEAFFVSEEEERRKKTTRFLYLKRVISYLPILFESFKFLV